MSRRRSKVDTVETLVHDMANALVFVFASLDNLSTLQRRRQRIEAAVARPDESPFLQGMMQLLSQNREATDRGIEEMRWAAEHALSLLEVNRSNPDARDELANLETIFTKAVCLAQLPVVPVVEIAVEPNVRYRKNQLERVLVNLLRNAANATDSVDEPEIAMRARECGDVVTIEVCDNGVGITDNERAAMFAPGYTTREDGSGHGLAIVARHVEALGGVVLAESAGPGCGARFEITLPMY